MTKKRVKLLLTLVVTLILCFMMLLGCQEESTAKTAYTIQVMSEGEKSLSDIEVYVYKDNKKEQLVWAAETDEEGKVTFEADESKQYFAFLQNVPDGYEVEEYYTIEDVASEIKLTVSPLDDTDLTNTTYQLGDVVHDFSVTAVDGTTYQLSELLQEKKAVVLNFWFINCGPCKMEFPFLQAAYDEYKNDIEVLAIDAYTLNVTNDDIVAYAQETGLTLPMAVGESQWQAWMKLTAYPTTVIIDRYGTIAMKHTGSITDKETFTKLFAYFTADDYKQTTIRNITDIK